MSPNDNIENGAPINGDDISITPDAIEESDQPEHRCFKLRRDLKKRLDKYLCDRFTSLSRSRLQKLINEGAVTVNGRQPKSSTTLRIGDVIDVVAPPPNIKLIPAENIPINVIYEDDHLIVINKHANFIVHPARSNESGTLVNALAYHFKDIKPNGIEALSNIGVDEFRPGIVHRLDKDTTGCIVVAKTDEAHWRLGKQFEHRQVQKYYLAIVHGQMPTPGDVIDCPIGKHPTVTEAQAVRNDRNGRNAVTIYRTREVYDNYSLVELELKTGRTHQIRVHLTWLGFPIISDIIYGGEPISQADIAPGSPRTSASGSQPFLTYARNKQEGIKIWDKMGQRDDLLIQRPALHAALLQFTHPATGETMTFNAPLPDDMSNLIKKLRPPAPGSIPGSNKPSPLPAKGAMVDIDKLM